MPNNKQLAPWTTAPYIEYRDPCQRTNTLLFGPQPYIYNIGTHAKEQTIFSMNHSPILRMQGPMPKNKQHALWTTAQYLE